MLKKIMKYEFKSSGRILLPFFGLAIAMSLVLRLILVVVPYVWPPLGKILTSLSGTLGTLMLVAIVLLAFVMVVVRFYQSLSTNEAYLTFTLPTTTGRHIWGRLIVGTVYSVGACLVAVLCGIIFIPGFFQGMQNQLTHTSNIPTSLVVQLFIYLFLFVVLGIANNLLHMYASIAIGTQFGRNRIIGSIVGYFILNMASSVISIVFMMLPFFSFLHSDQKFTAYFGSVNTAVDMVAKFTQFFGTFALLFGGLLLLLSAGYFVVTWYFFNKKLNLE